MVHDIDFNPSDGRIKRDGQSVRLTPKELAVLNDVVGAYPETVPVKDIYSHIYHARFGPAENIIRLYVMKLRRKLEPLGIKIISEPYYGYRLEVEAR